MQNNLVINEALAAAGIYPSGPAAVAQFADWLHDEYVPALVRAFPHPVPAQNAPSLSAFISSEFLMWLSGSEAFVNLDAIRYRLLVGTLIAEFQHSADSVAMPAPLAAFSAEMDKLSDEWDDPATIESFSAMIDEAMRRAAATV